MHINTVNFFLGIDIPVLDMYGMTESTRPQTITTINNWRIDSVDQCLNGTKLKILNPNENGVGEVCDIKVIIIIICKCFVHLNICCCA